MKTPYPEFAARPRAARLARIFAAAALLIAGGACAAPSKADYDAFIAAVRGGDLAAVEAALKKHRALACALDPQAAKAKPMEEKFMAAEPNVLKNYFSDSQLGENAHRPPLFIALAEDRVDVVRALLDAGASPAQRTPAFRPPGAAKPWYLGESVVDHCKSPEALELILARGAKVAEVDHGGRSWLTVAAIRGSIPMIDILLAKGAKMDVAEGPVTPDGQWFNPLGCAINRRFPEVAYHLLSKGADPNGARGLHPWGHPGLAALFIADLELARLLASKGARIRPDLATFKELDKLANQQPHDQLASNLRESGLVASPGDMRKFADFFAKKQPLLAKLLLAK